MLFRSTKIRLFFTFVFLAFSSSLWAQMDRPFVNNYSKSGFYLDFHGDMDFNSNVLTNDFVSKFYNSKFIDNSTKDKISSKLKSDNRFGGTSSYGITFGITPDTLWGKTNMEVFFGLYDKIFFNTQFSRDFFNLGMYGNKRFAGDTADLSGFNMNMLLYHKLQVGIIWKGLDTTKHATIGIGLAFLDGQQDYAIDASKAKLYTSADGQNMDIITSMKVNMTDTSHTNWTDNNGYGVSTDMFFEAPYKTGKRHGKITVTLKDLGLILWNNKSLQYQKDTTYHYEGFQVNNIFDLQDSTFQKFSTDSLRNKIAPMKKNSFATTLPATLNLFTNTTYGKFNFIKGIRYIFNANDKIYYYLQGDYHFTPKFILGLQAGYGGYGTFNGALFISKDFGKGLVIDGSINHIEGLVDKQLTGQGVWVTLRKYFK